MSPATHLSVLALASTALATRHGHMRHQYLHSSAGEGYAHGTGTGAPFAYPTANATGGWGSAGLPSYGASSSAVGYNTATEHVVHTEMVYQTIHAAYQSARVSAAAGGYGASASGSPSATDSCGVVTVTSTEKVTQYVTQGSAPSSSSEASPVETSSASAPGDSAPAYSSSSSSSKAAPVAASSAPAYSAPAYSAPAASSTEVAPTTAAASYSSSPIPSSSSSSVAAAAPVYSVINKGVNHYSSASKTASAAPSYSSASSAGGKRGLAYNDASLLSCFSDSREVSWAYNWGSSSNGLDDGFTFVPTLWGTASQFTDCWSENAKSAISAGSTHLFSFNEPDHSAQANLGYAAAATAYAQYMNPFKGQAQLCAPAVTNGGGPMGLTWLKNFLDSCTDCQIDCINVHWYDSAENTEYFKSHIEQAISLANGKPIFVSEFGATGSDDQIASFLQEVMPWMDSNSNIAGYAYFMVKDGSLISGTEPSSYGTTYKTYTS